MLTNNAFSIWDVPEIAEELTQTQRIVVLVTEPFFSLIK